MATNKRIPINRMNKWFDDVDFALEEDMGREAIEGDLNMVVILYRVDRGLTTGDDIYHEAGVEELRFKQPMELKVVASLAEPENKTYNDNGSLRYLQDGQLIFGIYQAQLGELDIDIQYGDYIGYPINETTVKYFTVVNDGRKIHDDKHTILGYRGAYRSVICAAVDDTEFSAI